MSTAGRRASPLLLACALSCSGGPGVAGIPATSSGRAVPTGVDAISEPDPRVLPHLGLVIPSMRLHVVYVGEEGGDGVPSRDGYIAWVLGSPDYWSLLEQYGVGYGALVDSVRVSTDAFFPPEVRATGTVTATALNSIVRALVQPGIEAVAARSPEGVAGPDAFIIFTPYDISITQSNGDVSCHEFSGSHTGALYSVPYAVIPWCVGVSTDVTISHELAEMATDPTYSGWYDDTEGPFDGEIGDLCNEAVTVPVSLWRPTRLWSNRDGACMPR